MRAPSGGVPGATSRSHALVQEPGFAASVELASGYQVTAVALYGLMHEFADASVHRSLSEISPLVDDRRYREHLLVGGDLNTSAHWPAGDPFVARDSNVLARFEALGLVDCLAATRPPGRLSGCTPANTASRANCFSSSDSS